MRWLMLYKALIKIEMNINLGLQLLLLRFLFLVERWMRNSKLGWASEMAQFLFSMLLTLIFAWATLVKITIVLLPLAY